MARLLDRFDGLDLQKIGRLTLWQVKNLYLHPRDRDGRIVEPPSGGSEETYEESFRAVWRARGLPPWRVDQKWREWLAAQDERGA